MPKKSEISKTTEMSKEELDALKEQLKKELLVEMKKDEAEKYRAEQAKKEADAIKISQDKPEFKIKTDSKIDKFDRNIQKNKTEAKVENIAPSSNMFLIVILFVVIGGIYFLPMIREAVTKNKTGEPAPASQKKKEEKEKKNYTWTDAEIKNITLPIMRNDINSQASYYTADKMTITSFTNNDILYNAFINVYSGSIAHYEGGYDGQFCGNDDQRRVLNAKYITARVSNMFNKNTEFAFTDFYVPLSSGSPYYGLWRYDAATHSYIYYGECNAYGILPPYYQDILLENKIETSEDGKTVYLTYNIAFAIVNSDSYEVYRDANYTDLLISDTFKTSNHDKELKDVLKEFNENHKLAKYKYTYSTIDCSYSEFCYISGEYTNE